MSLRKGWPKTARVLRKGMEAMSRAGGVRAMKAAAIILEDGATCVGLGGMQKKV